MTTAQALIKKAERREALFGVVGLGYVGLPLVIELARAGYKVLGFDILPKVVGGLNAGRSHVKDISDAALQEVLANGRFEATTDLGRLGEPDAISICVPTPLSKFKDPDVSYIQASTESVRRTLRKGQVVILDRDRRSLGLLVAQVFGVGPLLPDREHPPGSMDEYAFTVPAADDLVNAPPLDLGVLQLE